MNTYIERYSPSRERQTTILFSLAMAQPTPPASDISCVCTTQDPQSRSDGGLDRGLLCGDRMLGCLPVCLGSTRHPAPLTRPNLSSLSKDQDGSRVAPIQCEQIWGRENSVGMRFRACESSRQRAAATPASRPTSFRVPATTVTPYRGSWY